MVSRHLSSHQVLECELKIYHPETLVSITAVHVSTNTNYITLYLNCFYTRGKNTYNRLIIQVIPSLFYLLGRGDVLDGFLGILWIKLVIKVRYLDCVRQQKIKWSCVHLKTWGLFNFTKENQPLFFFQTRGSIWQVEVRFFQFLIWSGFWLLQGKDLTSKVNFSFNLLFRQRVFLKPPKTQRK